jgi:hypothetical protein
MAAFRSGGHVDAHGVWQKPNLRMPICPNCQRLDKVNFMQEGGETAGACMPFNDENGNQHLHDENYHSLLWYCTDCKKSFMTTQPHKCWCSWVQTGNEPLCKIYGRMWDALLVVPQ